jgi:TPP-dependent pyruvate/acetoin dehydrogenase alpha subunit
VAEALRLTSDFVQSTYRSVAAVAARGGSLKEAFAACRAACDEKFSSYAIYEHCLPFNVARAYDEAVGIDTPRIWTAERDRKMWEALQG